jgi:tetratricopeptide (TPR) repeat protein
MPHPFLKRTAGLVLPTVLLALLFTSASIAEDASLAKARRLFAAGSYDQARLLLESSIKAHTQDPEAHLLLGQIYTIEGRRADAIHELTRGIEIEPASAAAYNMLGNALNHFAEFDNARKAFEQAIVLDPKLPQAHINLAMSLAQGGDIPGAVEQLEITIRLQPTAPTAATAHTLLAKVYEDKDNQKAIDNLTAAVKIEPRNLEAWLALGKIQSAMSNEPAALSAFQHAVVCDPHDSEAQYELGSEYLAEGDAKQAVVHLQLARKWMPKPSMGLLYKLDRALRKEGDAVQAEQVRKQAQALLAEDTQANHHFQEAEALEHEGVDLEAKGEAESALGKYRAALELNPQQDGFRLNYALALCRRNRWTQGIRELNEILERDPSNAEARRALFIAMDKEKQGSGK